MKARRFAIGFTCALAGSLGAPAGTFAEEPAVAPPRGNIVGVVQDAGGTPVSGAAIEALDESGTVVQSARSSDAGGYEIRCLPEGQYSLKLDSTAGRWRGEKVVAPVGGEGLRVDWTVAPDKPALARAQPGGGSCAAAAAAGAGAAGAGNQAVSAGLLGGYFATTGTIAGLSASGAFDSGSSDSPNQ